MGQWKRMRVDGEWYGGCSVAGSRKPRLDAPGYGKIRAKCERPEVALDQEGLVERGGHGTPHVPES